VLHVRFSFHLGKCLPREQSWEQLLQAEITKFVSVASYANEADEQNAELHASNCAEVSANDVYERTTLRQMMLTFQSNGQSMPLPSPNPINGCQTFKQPLALTRASHKHGLACNVCKEVLWKALLNLNLIK